MSEYLNMNDYIASLSIPADPAAKTLPFYGRGNIDLNKRIVATTLDGSYHTELSKSFNFDGREILLPTVIDGRIVSNAEAISHYRNTGQHLGIFNTPAEADEYAQRLHLRQQEYYRPK